MSENIEVLFFGPEQRQKETHCDKFFEQNTMVIKITKHCSVQL